MQLYYPRMGKYLKTNKNKRTASYRYLVQEQDFTQQDSVPEQQQNI
jgi:hypothetical protein